MTASTLQAAAAEVLCAAAPADKVRLSRRAAAAWRAGELPIADVPSDLPSRPARPERPELRLPRDMPKRSAVGERGRIALLHSLAHIELNAIDLAWDLIARWAAGMPRAFADDWVAVADDEARHFALLEARLEELGSHYGALPAHDGLWEAAEVTADDLAARLAMVPMVLEARGLDVTPATVERLQRAGDERSAALLTTIYEDEKSHVAAGSRWFGWLCTREGIEPAARFRDIIRCRFRGHLKAPFNQEARAAAGIPESFYLPLARP